MNVRTRGDGGEKVELATVFVPRSKSGHFLLKIEDYKEKNTRNLDPEKVKPQNQPLIDSIENIRGAMLTAFWTDRPDKMPQTQPSWIEVWLAVDSNNSMAQDVLGQFRQAALKLDILMGNVAQILKFPERWVMLIYANQTQLLALIDYADKIAEFRAARETCSYFVETENREQAEWVQGLLERSSFDPSSNISVCILDGGVNSGHPMISPALDSGDLHTVEAEWGNHDYNGGHGTGMAGIAIYGDVQEAVDSVGTIEVRHKLESAKILPPIEENTLEKNPKELWGFRTAQGIYLAEIQAPQRRRISCLAITAEETSDRGRPTSWSAKLDQLASGDDDEEAGDNGIRRLILVSVGNIDDPEDWKNYPESNATKEIQDPAQSWNALSVGAYTNLTRIMDPDFDGYHPIAPLGGISPFSSTSHTWPWPPRWPIKPDIVMEGGNAARSPGGDAWNLDDLQRLSLWHKIDEAHFAVFGATSGATAHAAHFAAQIYAEYPELWPETVRGLLVHSARWTEAMETQYRKYGTSKGAYRQLLRSCGYGVPNLDIALRCLRNRLTLVSEAQLQPFDKKGSRYVTKDLHFYELPWPKAALQALGSTEVQLRITLSYFIEPGPGEKGWRNRYRYASHGLRFDLNNPNETRGEFIRRVNAQARDEDEGAPDTSSPSDHWVLGSQQRDVGSIHSDIWTGTAADLASSNFIAIRPSVGWWRERAHLGQWNRLARYSLIVSIETPVESVDIYTPVATLIATPVELEIEIET